MEHTDPAIEASNRRLDSWKEIAAFFHRDERTVRRWEKERSLPVYRMPGKARSSVYAFEQELREWLKSPVSVEPSPAKAQPQVTAQTGQTATPAKARSSRKMANFMIVAAGMIMASTLVAFRIIHSRSASIAGPATSASASTTAVPEALDLYLKGKYEWSKRSPESLSQAADYFNQAIALDPNYAQAYAGLADTYNLLREYTTMPPSQAYPLALAAARKAVQLDDSLSEAHRALAFASFYWNWDFPGGEREFKRAIELTPNDPVAHHWYATALSVLGRFPESLQELEHARQLDPGSASILADRALVLFTAQHGQESVSLLKQIEMADPSFLSPHSYLAAIALINHDYPAYLEEFRKVAALMHDQAKLEIVQAAEKSYAQGGGKALLESVRKVMEKYFEKGLISGFDLAQICALSGRDEEALKYLQDAFGKHDTAVLNIRSDHAFLGLHSDPVFRQLISRIGLPPL